MRVYIVAPDASGRTDGALETMLLNHFPVVAQQEESDAVIVPLARMNDYQFNPDLRAIRKPCIILDYWEAEWCFFEQRDSSLIFGKNGRENEKWLDAELLKLDDWLSENPPLLYLKRELLAKDCVGNVHPIDWPCALPIPEPQSEAEFNARPIEVFHCWGYSHPSRPRLHGQIFEAMGTKGIDVSDVLSPQASEHGKRKWVSIYQPYWCRRPIAEVMAVQQQSKLSVSLPGAGQKCFRSAESPVGSIMALRYDDLAWSYPWNDMENCIRMIPDEEFKCLEAMARYPQLYEIYLASQETIRKYQSKTYIENYIQPLIAAAL